MFKVWKNLWKGGTIPSVNKGVCPFLWRVRKNDEKEWMMKQKKGILLVILCMVLPAGCFGCGRPSPAYTEREESGQNRMSVSCLVEQFLEAEPDTGNAWFRRLEEMYDIDFSITCIPTLNFKERFPYLVASNKVPTIVMTNGTVMDSGVLHREIQSGRFWCLDEYIDDYKNLRAFVGETALENMKIDGHLYGIPRIRILPRNAGYYRKDWADRLGIDPPETLEELYGMLYRFTYDDPDGNGMDDTVGLVSSLSDWGGRSWNGLQTITVIMGGINNWKYIDGKMTPDFLSDEWLKMLKYFRRLYQDGVLNQDCAVINAEQRKAAITEGKTGMVFGVIEDIMGLETILQKTEPEAELELLPMLRETEESEYYVNSTSGNNGMIMFTRYGENAVKTEEELRTLLAMYDDLCTEKGQDFLLYGIEGVHYTRNEEGKRTVQYNENGYSILSKEQGDFALILPINGYQRDNERWGDRLKEEIEERSRYLVGDDSVGLISETYLDKEKPLDAVIMEGSIRFIMGEIDEEEYENICGNWYQSGGKAMIEEYTAMYESKLK